jgi:2'-5' RNA ligase
VRKSAVVIEVPQVAPLVDGWRRQHTDDAPLGVPAHVTLLTPWVPAEQIDEQVEQRLADLLREADAFDFVLRRTARFREGPLLYLPPEPPEPFVRLTEAIAAEWPEHPPYEGIHDTIVPHLTVAQADDGLLDEIADVLEPELPIESRATEALLLEEGEDGFWRGRSKLLLGATLAVALALAGCGSSNGKVATVGSTPITQKQLDALVAHFQKEAEAEGRSFPKKGTDAYRIQRNQLLGLLVYREELRRAAKRLGVTVSEDEISRRLAEARKPAVEQSGDSYAHDSIEAQLIYERLYRKLTARVQAKTPEELTAKRNQVIAAFLAKLQRETRVRYEPGFAPSS